MDLRQSNSLKYDIWKKSTSPMAIPHASATRQTSSRLLCESLPEFLDAALSTSLREQCQLDEQLDGANSGSSEASWISRWWSDAGDSKTTSWSTWKTDNSCPWQATVAPKSDVADMKLGRDKRNFPTQKRNHVSALSAMIRKDPGPQPLCPPKHDIWAVMATARKIQPTLGKLARCPSQGDRKVRSCPTPQLQRMLEDEANLSPSSASEPRAIPRPRETLRCATGVGESMDTSYTSANSDPVTDSSCESPSSPGLVSREEQQSRLLDRLMDHFFAVLANNDEDCGGSASSSQTALSSREPVAPNHGARSSARRGAAGKGKRSATPEDGGSDEENDGPRLKKTKIDETEVRRLACPFFKKNPYKYKDQSKCVGPGWTTVHRLKEHLYRRHRLPVHCLRCQETFFNEDGLEQHLRSPTPCQRRAVKTLEGISPSQERQLRSRKRSDKTEEEKWRDVYQICFPLREDEDPIPIPSPYFELPNGTESGGPGPSSDMARYDEFMSRELPRRVRKALELRIEQEFSPVEESLKRQLPDIVRGLYQALSEDFRSSLKANPLPKEEIGEDQEPGTTKLTGDGDVKGKGKMVASAVTLQPLMEAPDTLGEVVVDEAPVCDNYCITSQPIDVCRPLQPFFVESLAGLDSWMCGVGQGPRDWSWPDSEYLPGAMTTASSAMMSDHGCNIFGNDAFSLQIPYTGENGVYQDRLSLT